MPTGEAVMKIWVLLSTEPGDLAHNGDEQMILCLQGGSTFQHVFLLLEGLRVCSSSSR